MNKYPFIDNASLMGKIGTQLFHLAPGAIVTASFVSQEIIYISGSNRSTSLTGIVVGNNQQIKASVCDLFELHISRIVNDGNDVTFYFQNGVHTDKGQCSMGVNAYKAWKHVNRSGQFDLSHLEDQEMRTLVVRNELDLSIGSIGICDLSQFIDTVCTINFSKNALEFLPCLIYSVGDLGIKSITVHSGETETQYEEAINIGDGFNLEAEHDPNDNSITLRAQQGLGQGNFCGDDCSEPSECVECVKRINGIEPDEDQNFFVSPDKFATITNVPVQNKIIVGTLIDPSRLVNCTRPGDVTKGPDGPQGPTGGKGETPSLDECYLCDECEQCDLCEQECGICDTCEICDKCENCNQAEN